MPWSFKGTSFAIVSGGAFDEEWFDAKVNRSVDPVAGGTAIYVDIGATVRAPLGLVAQFTSKATRDSFAGLLGSTGTLTDDDGRTASALLARAQPVRVVKKDSGLYRLNLEFEYYG